MENIFKFEEKNYNIISENSGTSDRSNWEEKITDITRENTIYTWRPWWIGNKFRWLKKIRIKERLIFIRYSVFDDGWSYKHFWKPWSIKWEAEEILD
jgi:hypothetical protein